ncbi:plasmid segregation protein ParM domain-containing protein [Escherichia coli]|uniref:plasmid segregation protein ParM domain-containing protein n=1 Tax=Escherichia coli TaxID=562 RepID=UPI002D1E3DC5|nr:plasmid segregation protein ParM domain-containing protein [Escherichia coli]
MVFIDDGSTNIKLQWQESDGTIKQHIKPEQLQTRVGSLFCDKKVFNYTLNGRTVFHLIQSARMPVVTTISHGNTATFNVVAVHHALLTSGLPVSEVDIVCTLPLTE